MPESRARYVMVGGFLGAGKTTAVLRLARHLKERGLRVGLITNDQSTGLVDTALADAQGFDVEEITGGCFCCRFGSLLEAAERLSAETRPDVFIAEPVGSCTDLTATVSYPLRRIYGGDFRVAPLSVLVDPLRAERVLGLEPGRAFSPRVLYVYGKQIEEAEIVVINKVDLLTPARVARLERALRERNPRADVFAVSARDGSGLDAWFERLGAEAGTATPPELDYDAYAEGEALLGWLNATLRLECDGDFDGNLLLRDTAGRVQSLLGAEGIEVAHFKTVLTPDEDGADLGVLNLVRGDATPEMSHTLKEPLGSGEMVVNLRAEGEPERLEAAVRAALAAALGPAGVRMSVEHLERFRPARPVPVHRLAEA
ncbi:MAG TPA: GTP-binding protein [Vicinamibacteria bacterium]|nr:GTP-binding protein [Vicinamibacteria bacterium]